MQNKPSVWAEKLKFPTKDDNKYTRGSSIIYGGSQGKLGASKLASIAALRSGCGIVTICCNKETLGAYEAWATSVMIRKTDEIEEFYNLASDNRVKSILIGPGSGVNDKTKNIVLAALKLNKPCILDADAITIFKENPKELFASLHKNTLLTPHMGEFSKIFKVLEEDKISLTSKAAKIAGCSILLKGYNTIIADENSNVIINEAAPPNLATAGSGDVLAGIITGIVATGNSVFDSACIGTWIHTAAGRRCSFGMISEDLLLEIKAVMKELFFYKNTRSTITDVSS